MAAKMHEIYLQTYCFLLSHSHTLADITMTIQVHSSSQWGIPQVYKDRGFSPGVVQFTPPLIL